MVRACCVCDSGKNVPSHMFPRDKERCQMWVNNLCLNVEETEIKKLRVCYKHFKDEDYSGSATRRVLIHSAIPININVTRDTSLMDVPCEANNKDQEDEVQREISTCQDNEEMLNRHEIELQQHQNILMQQQQEIENIKKTLSMPRKQIRPDLEEITRKRRLNPKARKLYERLVKMMKQKRRLKRLLHKHKKENVIKSIELCTTNHKSNHATAHMRQQLINMMIRNNDKAPQVNFHSQ